MITAACIHYLEYLPNRLLMHRRAWKSGLTASSETFHLGGGSIPRFLLAFCLLPGVGLPLQCPRLTRNKDAPFLLGCSVLPLPFGMMCSFVMFRPFCARPTSLPALNLAARDPSAEEQVTVTPWEGQNLSQTSQKFCTRFWELLG